MSGRKNVEIKNGTVRGFTSTGIYESSSANAGEHRIINVRTISNSGPGINLRGHGHLVRECTSAENSGHGIQLGGSVQTFVSMYTTEAGTDSADVTDWEMGVVFEIDCAEFPSGGFLHGVKFHKQLANTGIHTVRLWSNTTANTQHRTETVVNESLSGWQSQLFTTQGPFALTCGAPGYVASYTVPVGSYTFTSNYFQAIEPNIDGEDRNAPLYFPDTTNDGRSSPIGNARYSTTPGIAPVFTFSGASYWVDIIWSETE